MKILNKYLTKLYLKIFLLILISLEFFYVGINFLQNSKDIPDSANLQFLYLFYSLISALNVNLVLSLIISWIVMLVILVKRNELVAFMALGISKIKILIPILLINIAITSTFIFMKFTPLAYSKSWQSNILDNDYFSNSKEDIFVKYNDYYIYMKKLYPEKMMAENLVIYHIKKDSIDEIVEAKKALYKDGKWKIAKAKVTTKYISNKLAENKISISKKENIEILNGFKPKILDNVYESKEQLSIVDGFKAFFLLKEQGIKTEKILINLYATLTIPLFLIPILIIIYVQTPLSSRFFSSGKFIAIYIFASLSSWGINFILFRLGGSGSISVEFAIFSPIVILLLIMSYLIYKKGV